MANEDLCRCCAQCCHEKIVAEDNEVYQTAIPCSFLDQKTNLCTVYAKRHSEQVRCLTVAEGIKARAFPADCPYVQGLADYLPPLPLPDDIDATDVLEACFPDGGQDK